MPNNWIEYLTALMEAIVDGRIEAKTFRDFTPEQKEEYLERLVAEEKSEIEKGLARHHEDD